MYILLFLVFISINIFMFSGLAHWREDEATNLWLGFRALNQYPSIGLMSSKAIPNPNGMPLLGFFLSHLSSNLIFLSGFLFMLQIGGYFLLSRELIKDRFSMWIFFSVLCLWPISGVAGSEFSNQFVSGTINVFFIWSVFQFVKKQSFKNYFIMFFILNLFPAIYLAGVSNFVAGIGILIWCSWDLIRLNKLKMGPMLTALFLSTFIFLIVTWIPFFRSIELNEFSSEVLQVSALKKLFRSMVVVPRIPFWITTWAKVPSFILFDNTVIGRFIWIKRAISLLGGLWFLQVFICVGSLLRRSNFLELKKSLILFVFVLIAYMVTPLLGGPSWHWEQRQDQVVQFQPILLLLFFSIPYMDVPSTKFQAFLKSFTLINGMVFMALSFFIGIYSCYANYQYLGSSLTEADVPLLDKIRVVDEIAKNWEGTHSKEMATPQVSVLYELQGGWGSMESMIPEKFNKFYGTYPFVVGRALDFVLLKKYGLNNLFEGKKRPHKLARYVVSYAFEAPPKYLLKASNVEHQVIGRLRLSICGECP